MDNYYGDPYMMWHDGIDETAVRVLKGEERQKAEELLIQSLKEGSHYGAIGLRELRSANALPILKEYLETSTGTLRVEIAIALCLIEQTHEYLPHILDVLKHHPFWSVRYHAAIALRRFPTNEVVESLFTALAKDPDYLVRNHTSETILFLHRLKPSISERKDIFKLIIVEYEKDPDYAMEQYRRASDMLREVVESEGNLKDEYIIEDIWTWDY